MKRPRLKINTGLADTGEKLLTLRIHGPEAQRLADLSGIERDLQFALDALARLLEHMASVNNRD